MCQKMENYGNRVAKEATKRAEKKKTIEMISNLMNINHLSAEDAMKMLGILTKQQSQYLKHLV